ncbi:LOW QUALITY PROTEIN: hypothetical protein PanWU01x14_255390 [Parasponia andersonii]|uniref:Transmembrane protein n=1 Tax=Parasponia andersonii TaxID=3476 RepID=A0A2P5BAQ7_PARAD|nr:LOW QUALITY PROTEIN: hypothetical protein PanWU01x14_255390 [Parasponia andersonii]
MEMKLKIQYKKRVFDEMKKYYFTSCCRAIFLSLLEARPLMAAFMVLSLSLVSCISIFSFKTKQRIWSKNLSFQNRLNFTDKTNLKDEYKRLDKKILRPFCGYGSKNFFCVWQCKSQSGNLGLEGRMGKKEKNLLFLENLINGKEKKMNTEIFFFSRFGENMKTQLLDFYLIRQQSEKFWGTPASGASLIIIEFQSIIFQKNNLKNRKKKIKKKEVPVSNGLDY